jgi:hypothetical protein
MARNTNRTNRPRLTQRGATVVALVAAVAVVAVGMLWQAGYAPQIILGAASGVLVVRYRKTLTAPAAHRKMLRGAGWVVAGVAVLFALNGSTAAGGPLLGLALAAALVTYLRLSR